MKVLKIGAAVDSYSGSGQNYFPIILLGASLLQSAYNDVDGVGFSGGSVNVTTKAIDAVNSFSNETAAVTLTNPLASTLQVTTVTAVGTNTVEVYKLRAGDTSTASEDGGGTFDAPDYDKHVTTGDNEILEVSSVSTTSNVLKTNGSGTMALFSAVKDLTTVSETVVTGVTGGGGAAFSPDVDYEFDGNTIGITGDGYKKKLSDTFRKPLKIRGIRFFIEGTDGAFGNFDVLNQESYILEADGSEVKKNRFTLFNYFMPNNVQSNIVDFPFEGDIDQDTAIVIGALKSSTVTYSIAIFYDD